MAHRVLILSLHYKPEENFIVTEVAEAIGRSADVIVVTAHPNYPRGKFYSGKIFPAISKSVEQGVVVWRVPYFPDHSLSIVRRTLSYLSFTVMIAIVAPFVAGRPDTVWVYHGPFTTALAGLFFKLVYRARLLITCADLWPASFLASGVVKSSLLIKLAALYNRAIHGAADLIICSTKGTEAAFLEMGVPADRLTMIPVWIEGTATIDPSKLQQIPEPTIVYTGNLGPAQALETVIRAAAVLHSQSVMLRFDLFGSGAAESTLRDLANSLGATNVRFRGRVPTSEAFAAARAALAQIVCLRRSPEFRRTVPSKLFAAFAASTPVLYGLEGEAAAIAAESGGGIAFDSDDPDSFVRAVKTLLASSPNEIMSMRLSVNRFFAENFDPKLLLEKYRRNLDPTSGSIGKRGVGSEALFA